MRLSQCLRSFWHNYQLMLIRYAAPATLPFALWDFNDGTQCCGLGVTSTGVLASVNVVLMVRPCPGRPGFRLCIAARRQCVPLHLGYSIKDLQNLPASPILRALARGFIELDAVLQTYYTVISYFGKFASLNYSFKRSADTKPWYLSLWIILPLTTMSF